MERTKYEIWIDDEKEELEKKIFDLKSEVEEAEEDLKEILRLYKEGNLKELCVKIEDISEYYEKIFKKKGI